MIVIAIDGPAGSGKSTVARAVAERLGVPHVDTGAYYRAATLAVLRAGLDPSEDDRVAEVVQRAEIDRVDGRTMLDGEDVERQIRGPQVTAAVSAVSAQPAVRAALLDAQRSALNRGGGVVEGRDAATNVVPGADVKVWLDADVNERARRRALQAGEPDNVHAHLADLRRRDAADHEQMLLHTDATPVDTTGMSLGEVVEAIAELARRTLEGAR